MIKKKQTPETGFLHKPFDLNRNGRINPAEAALMMMVFDDIENQIDREIEDDVPSYTPHTTNAFCPTYR